MERYFEWNDPGTPYGQRVVENNRLIDELIQQGDSVPETLKAQSVNMLVLKQGRDQGYNACNWGCGICYTKESFGLVGLTGEQLVILVENVKKLGARSLYIPGIGEPTKSNVVWYFLQKELSFPTVLFTNGSYLHDPTVEQDTGLSQQKMLELVRDGSVYQYVKFWTTDPGKGKMMYGRPDVPFTQRNGLQIPFSLSVLLDEIPREKLGIEVVARQENFEELPKIISFAEEYGIRCFVEPVIPVPQARHAKLSPEQEHKLQRYLAIHGGGVYCDNRASRDMTVVVDSLAPCVSFPRREDYRVVSPNGLVKRAEELFSLFHTKEYREVRKSFECGNCACNDFLEGKLQWGRPSKTEELIGIRASPKE